MRAGEDIGSIPGARRKESNGLIRRRKRATDAERAKEEPTIPGTPNI